jgi:hypothetical protein
VTEGQREEVGDVRLVVDDEHVAFGHRLRSIGWHRSFIGRLL